MTGTAWSRIKFWRWVFRTQKGSAFFSTRLMPHGAELAPQVSADPLAVADTQEKLGRAILTFNQYSMVDPEWIKDAALAIIRKIP